MNEEKRRTLRNSLRQARRNLNLDQQKSAARGVHGLVTEQDFFTNASHIVFYQSIDGEIDPKLL